LYEPVYHRGICQPIPTLMKKLLYKKSCMLTLNRDKNNELIAITEILYTFLRTK